MDGLCILLVLNSYKNETLNEDFLLFKNLPNKESKSLEFWTSAKENEHVNLKIKNKSIPFSLKIKINKAMNQLEISHFHEEAKEYINCYTIKDILQDYKEIYFKVKGISGIKEGVSVDIVRMDIKEKINATVIEDIKEIQFFFFFFIK